MKEVLRAENLNAFLRTFYEKALPDPVLAPAFAGLDLEAHLPRIEAFWSNILFDTPGYSGNPMEAHRRLMPLHREQFSRWLHLFQETLEAYEGEAAVRASQRAQGIAMVMQIKLGVTD